MKVLTVKQPWAWALIHGPKRIENRTWETSYRGPLLIHAGKSRTALGDEEDLLPDLPSPNQLSFGAIIGVVDLIDCVPVSTVVGDSFAEGPFCWLVARPRPCVPFACAGALSLWLPPKEFQFVAVPQIIGAK